MNRKGANERCQVESEGKLLKKKDKRTTEKWLHRQLVKYEALPEFLKDNEFILDHYRSEWPLKDVFLSAFTWHNETLNIWTHLVGFFIFLIMTVLSSIKETNTSGFMTRLFRSRHGVTAPLMTTMMNSSIVSTNTFSLLSWEQQQLRQEQESIAAWPWYIFLTGAMSCLVCSSLSHLFACHSKHYNLFFWRLDYAGISFMIVSSFFAPIYYTFHCNPFTRLLYLTTISIFGLLAVFTLLAPSLSSPTHRSFRAYLFLAMGFSGIVPAFHACVLHWGHPHVSAAIGYEVAMAVFYATGAVVYVTRVPERWRPGVFDLAGHSHQIFHVLVLAGALAHTAGTLVVIDWRRGAFLDGC